MPQRSKGARLWLRPARTGRAATYIIKDDGRHISTGCGADDLRGAEQALARYLAARHAREAAETRGRSIDDTPVADVLLAYWQVKQGESARPRELQAQLGRLNAWWGDRSVGDVTERLCREYVAHRGARRAAGIELSAMRAAINHAFRQRLITAPVPVWIPPQNAPRERWLTRDEMARLLWAAWRYRETQKGAPGRYTRRHVARFILMARYTGSRAGAICAASLEPLPGRGYVDLASGVYYRAGEMERATKKRKPTIRLPAPLLAHIRRWHRAAARDGKTMRHVVEWNGKPVLSIRKAFGRVRDDAGLGEDVTPHILRHSAITWAMQAGADPWEVAGYFGATREVIERVYGHQHPDHQGTVHRSMTGRRA